MPGVMIMFGEKQIIGKFAELFVDGKMRSGITVDVDFSIGGIFIFFIGS